MWKILFEISMIGIMLRIEVVAFDERLEKNIFCTITDGWIGKRMNTICCEKLLG